MIPLNRPIIYPKNKETTSYSVDEILQDRFENKYVEMVYSARQGLDIIYNHLYEKKGSCKVAVSPLTCFEALFPILNNKHTIEFVDIEPSTFNMNADLIPDDVDIIQAIHLGGNPQDLKKLGDVASKISAILVEDCAQAFGSTYRDLDVGNYGDFAVFSLSKNIYSLAGGCIVSKDEIAIPTYKNIKKKVLYYRRLKRFLESKNSYNTKIYEFLLLSLVRLKPESTSHIFSTYTINKQVLSSILVQLEKGQELTTKRMEIARSILDKIDENTLQGQKITDHAMSNYLRLYFKVQNNNAVEVIKKLRKKKIWANHLSQNTLSVFQEKIYENMLLKKYANPEKLQQYNEIHDSILSIPISPSFTQDEIDYISNTINAL